MTPNNGFGLVAGISVTAAVAATSVVSGPVRRSRNAEAAANPKPTPKAAPATIYRSASRETPYVFGNMILMTNM